MGTCKQCGKETPLMIAFCDECDKINYKSDLITHPVDSLENQTKGQNEKIHTQEEIIDLVNQILIEVTPDPPLDYAFINRDISLINENEEREWKNMFIGGVLFGVAGASLAGIFSQNKYSYFGDLGIIVVTKKHVSIIFIPSRFSSWVGEITFDHLTLLLSSIKSESSLNKIVFNIDDSQILKPNKPLDDFEIISKMDRINFRKSELVVNDSVFQLSNLDNLSELIIKLGSIVTIPEFIEELLKQKNPMTESQFNKLENCDEYFNILILNIIKHKERNKIISNIQILEKLIKEKMFSNILDMSKQNSNFYKFAFIVSLIFFLIIFFISLGILIFIKDPNAVAFTIFSGLFLVIPIGFYFNYKKSSAKIEWCKSIVKTILLRNV